MGYRPINVEAPLVGYGGVIRYSICIVRAMYVYMYRYDTQSQTDNLLAIQLNRHSRALYNHVHPIKNRLNGEKDFKKLFDFHVVPI